MTDAAATFRVLHAAGFIMPNAWDIGSALVLAGTGFPAIATTSAGIAFSLGLQDYTVDRPHLAVPRDVMLARKGEIARAVRIPVNGDLEAGYGDQPEEVAQTIRLAIEAGLAGGNIEDKMPLALRLYDEQLAVDRIRAARETIDGMGSAFVLTARSDAILWSKGGVAEAIRRSNLYRAAGADCSFTPGASDPGTIRTLVHGIDGPLNMVMGLGGAQGNARDWIGLGVRRISVGGSLARAVLGFVHRAAQDLKDSGSIRYAEGQIPQGELNALFAANRVT